MKNKVLKLCLVGLLTATVFGVKANAVECELNNDVGKSITYVEEAMFAGEDEIEVLDAGYCGKNVLWGVTSDGLLLILSDGEGDGKMYNYGDTYTQPWRSYDYMIRGLIVYGNVKYIGNHAFSNLDKLTNVYIEEGVQSIGSCVFQQCDVLKEIVFPNSVTTLGQAIFRECPKLTKVQLPAKVKKIADYMFHDCSALTTIIIPNGVTEIGYSAFGGCTKLNNVKIPNTVTKIGEYSFVACEGLTSITLSNSLKIIDRGAFQMCGFKTITIPSSVMTINDFAFLRSDLEKITIPSSVTYLGGGAFFACKKLVEVSLPDSVTKISDSLFCDCDTLKTVRIPSTVTFIDRYAFQDCENLTTMRLPSNVKTIEANAFGDCPNLKTVTIMNPNADFHRGFIFTSEKLVIRCIEGSSVHETLKLNGRKCEFVDLSVVTDYFDDVYTDWYTDYVQYVYDNRLMSGMKNTAEFKPNANITKAQVAQVLYNIEEQPEVTNQSVFEELQDVYAVEWYGNAVAWAYNNGIVTGDLNEKKFFPNANVTREQLALMLFRYAAYKEYDITAEGDLSGLKNDWKVSTWALDGVKWAVGEGLISGIDNNGVKDLAPQGNATRAQMAAILQRFCEKVKN